MTTPEVPVSVWDKNLILFIRVNAILIALFTCLQEQTFMPLEGMRPRYFFTFPSLTISSQLLPTFGFLPSFFSTHWFLQLSLFSLLAGCAAILVFPRIRIGYFGVFYGILSGIFADYYQANVLMTTVYLIPFLLLTIQPPRVGKEALVRRNLIFALGLMYFFSAVSKLTPYYFSNVLMQDYISGLLHRNFIPLLNIESFKYLLTYSGVLLELLGSLMMFPRFRKIGIYSAILFHASVMVLIIWSLSLFLYALTLPLLFLKEKKETKAFYPGIWIWILSLLCCHLTWGAINPQFSLNTANNIFDLINILWIAILLVFVGIELLRTQISTEKGWAFAGVAVPVLYFLLTLVFSWPEPFGYTQYAGREYVLYGRIFRIEDPNLQDKMSQMFPSRWNNQFYQILDKRTLAAFTDKKLAGLATEKICSRFPSAYFKEFITEPTAKFPFRFKIRSHHLAKMDQQAEQPCANYFLSSTTTGQ